MDANVEELSDMTRRVLQVGAGVTLGVVVSLLLVLPDVGPPPEADEHLLPGPFPAPEVRLTDHRGEALVLPGRFDGVTAVFFGYTHCPDVCPLTVGKLAAVAEELPADVAERFRTVFVTVDPARDTPERLAEYLGRFDSTFVGLTGSERQVREAARAWGVYAERPAAEKDFEAPADSAPAAPEAPQRGGREVGVGPADSAAAAHGAPEGYVVDHTSRAFVIGPGGRVVATFPASATPETMVATVLYLLGERR